MNTNARYRYRLERREYGSMIGDFFKRDNLDETSTTLADHGPYTLWKGKYTTGPNSWNFTRARIFCGTKLLFDVKRNYSTMWYAFVLNHAVTGQDYFLTSENYWGGYSAFNLTTGYVTRHIPEKQEKDRWCWGSILPSPSGTRIAVDGCYWASSWTTRVYDFSKPTKEPFPILWDGERPDHSWAFGGGAQRWDDENRLIVDCFRIDDSGDFAEDPRPYEEQSDDDDGMLHREMRIDILSGDAEEVTA